MRRGDCRCGTVPQSHRPSVLVSALSTTFFPDFFRRRPIFAIFAVRRPTCAMAKCLGQNCALTCEDCERCIRRTDEREEYVVCSSFLSTIPRANLRRTVRRLCEDLRTLCKHVLESPLVQLPSDDDLRLDHRDLQATAATRRLKRRDSPAPKASGCLSAKREPRRGRKGPSRASDAPRVRGRA